MLCSSAPFIDALDFMKKILISAVFVLTFIFGATDVWLENAPRQLNQIVLWVSIISVSVLIFGWVHVDARERQYPKSKWLNVGVLAFSIIFVPIYLFRSRPKGDKLRALAGYALALLGYVGFGYAGSMTAYQFLP